MEYACFFFIFFYFIFGRRLRVRMSPLPTRRKFFDVDIAVPLGRRDSILVDIPFWGIADKNNQQHLAVTTRVGGQ